MISVYSVLYTLVLISELSSHSVTAAAPANKEEDIVTEQDGLSFLLEDEPMIEPAVVPPVYWRKHVLDNSVRDEDGKHFISDARLKRQSMRGLNPAFTRSLPLLADRSLSYTPAEHSLKFDRRNTDLDVLRCMIGRVYRPCWQE
ncbi:pro-MCH [Chaetodon auriga]|uniref:pro-MCH n=1 Tax=Chaetodon auriga TaxID=39042 RepID=UPI004032F356